MADGVSELIGLFLVVFLMCVVAISSFVGLVKYLDTGESYSIRFRRIMEILVFLPAVITMVGVFDGTNDCCHDSAFFSPDHRLSVYVLAVASLLAVFYSSYRKRLAPPLIEVFVNCCLMMGILLDVAIGIQSGADAWPGLLLVNVPVGFQIVVLMGENHRLAMECLEEQEVRDDEWLIAFCRKIVFMPVWKKLPLLLVLCLPVLCMLAGALTLFGQKPDSMIRAFTDTYHHGLSQLDYQCEGVECPERGHYLCTIAARGHPGVVRPIRAGERGGRRIICNRQLLVSNAFEELLGERAPWLHRPVRKFYDKIGVRIHRYYGVFDHAWVSDTIYFLMKPLEWGFVIVLYMADRRPEDRIARQYLPGGVRLRRSGELVGV